MTVQCARSNCLGTATHRLEFRLALVDGGEAPGDACLYVCRQHATEEAAAAMFDYEPGREQIEQEFAARGMPGVDWVRSRAVWIALPAVH